MRALIVRFTVCALSTCCFVGGLVFAAQVSAAGGGSSASPVSGGRGPLRAGPAASVRPPRRRRAPIRLLAGNSASYSDPSGDNNGAPDITTVTVANDDSGAITMAISLPNRATLDADMYIDVYVDTDQNSNTGLAGGADYLMRTVGSESKIYLYSCSSTVCDGAVSAPSISGQYDHGLTIHITRTDLHAAAAGFAFYIDTYSCQTTCVKDQAGEWSYAFSAGQTPTTTATATTTTTTTGTTTTATTTARTTTGTTTTRRPPVPPPPPPGSLSEGPPPPGLPPGNGTLGGPPTGPATPGARAATTTVLAQTVPAENGIPARSNAALVVTVSTFSPRAPRSGKTFTVRLTVARADTGQALQSGTLGCQARVGIRTLKATIHSFVNGRAVCSWKIPKVARGKRLLGSVRVASGSLHVSQAMSLRIS